MCYYGDYGLIKGELMRLLRLAVERQRWDLAAHTIVLAAAGLLHKGDTPDAGKNRAKKKCRKGHAERQ